MERLSSFRPDALKTHRRDAGLSLAAVAELLGPPIDRARVWQWENGLTTPSPAMLLELAAAVRVRPEQLLEVDADIGPTLAQLRLVAGLTRPRLAQIVEIPRSTYDRLERGRGRARLPEDLVTKLASALRVSPDQVQTAYAASQRGAQQ